HVAVRGHIWGRPVEPLLEPLSTTMTGAKFDLILLSDLIFNHAEHHASLWTCEHKLAPRGCVLVFYTHHRPHLAERDMRFFDLAGETEWTCEKVLPPMFPEDMGDEGVRATVHGWVLTQAGGD
ncbi:nicotinamide n-methyltransferase, partial [Lactarius tabidus]